MNKKSVGKLNKDLEIGQILQVAVNSISFIESNAVPGGFNTNTTSTEIELKKPVSFDLICELGRNERNKYLYCHCSERLLAIPLLLNDGRVAYLDWRSGFETIEGAKIKIGEVIGNMYTIMLDSSLEEVKKFAIYKYARERLNGRPRLSDKTDAELDEMAEGHTENNKRREIIYTWYMENCSQFNSY